MKTPRFWHHNGLLAQIILPLSVIYFLAKRIKLKKTTPHKFNLKIICIGNVVAGGAGKTPTAIAGRKILQKSYPHAKITFVSKGYKGKISEPTLVDLKIHKPQDVGDEAILLALNGDAIIGKDRFEAVKFAESLGYEIVILDDGLHDNRIIKDKSFVVIDGKYGFGNGLLFPAGPMRDRLDFAVNNADEIILIGKDEKKAFVKVKHATRKNYHAIEAKIKNTNELSKEINYIAFAGIGRPSKFYDSLNELGLKIIQTVDFADHHNYSEEDIFYLKDLAKVNVAKLVTTEKDFVKLPENFKTEVDCLKIEIIFEDSRISEVLRF
jgi:tetraacyldisaccharide 4'-kinase